MIDLSAGPKRIQELMMDGHTLDEAVIEARKIGLDIHVWFEVDVMNARWADDPKLSAVVMDDATTIEFYHKESKLRWFARFSGYDAETVEVFGLVNSWEV